MNGALFDAYALAFGLTLAGVVLFVYALRAKHAAKRRPFDWSKDAPEYARAKDAHVKVVP